MINVNNKVVNDFGSEWKKFDQSNVSEDELKKIWNKYFSLFPWETLPKDAKGFDLGCGSGRWALFTALKVGELHCIDPAEEALNVAKEKLKHQSNCKFHNVIVDDMPFEDDSMDFGYSLGVLHHIPYTELGIKMCVKKLKYGAPFLLYLYYALDNKPFWFKMVWKISDILRRLISLLPKQLKYLISECVAICVYYPLARFSKLLEMLNINVENIPLSFYRDKSFYTMRTDALDRFGTRLEQRFSKQEIYHMMTNSGLSNIEFCEKEPFWCAIGYKKSYR